MLDTFCDEWVILLLMYDGEEDDYEDSMLICRVPLGCSMLVVHVPLGYSMLIS